MNVSINKANVTKQGNYTVFEYKDENGDPTGFIQGGGSGSFFAWTETENTIIIQHEGSNVFMGSLSDITVNGNAVNSLTELLSLL